MRTAAVPINSTILAFNWAYAYSGIMNNQFYANLHVMELLPNTTRSFNVYLNGEWCCNCTPVYLRPSYVYSVSPVETRDYYDWALNSSGLSTLPPILNALEVYSPLSHVEIATDSGDVDAITNIKMQYQVKKNWMGDPCAPKKYIWDGINCNYASSSSRIIVVNLSSSGLTGFISSYFTNLTALQYLDLSSNNLTGPIPEALGNIVSLQVLNLSCNNITGTIPSSLLERSQQGLLKFYNNSNSCSSNSHVIVLDSPAPSPSGNDKKTAITVSVSVVAAVLLLIVMFFIWRTRKLQGFYSSTQPESSSITIKDSSSYPFRLECRQFTYMQLTKITNNFAKVIGKGGFGIVCLGYLESGEQVAVKMCAQSSRQGTKEFLAEVRNLTRIHHRNLVSLIGYCMDGEHLALVYEYMSKGSLYEQLRGRAGEPGIISWRERLRIAVEAAQGLEYLHKGCDPPIVHRDIKTNNILLSSALEAKIADFGLSKAFISNLETHVSTMSVAGTPGYVDPEYHNTLQLTEKSDVYSFGVVLLELITGFPPIMPNSGTGHIIQRVSPSIAKGDLGGIVDERLHGRYDANSVWKVLDLAVRCTAQTSNQRPTMSDVVSQLKHDLELVILSEKNDRPNTENHANQSTSFEIVPGLCGPSAR